MFHISYILMYQNSIIILTKIVLFHYVKMAHGDKYYKVVL